MQLGSFGLLALLAIGTIGAIAALKVRLPAGAFLGPVLSVGAFQVIVGSIAGRPMWFRLVIQIAVGLVLGSSFATISLQMLGKLLKPAVVISVGMLGGGILIGYLLSLYTGWDLTTAILSTAPGGQAEMVLFAETMDAATEKVLVLQIVRSQMAMLLLLPAVRFFLNYNTSKERERCL